MRIGLGMGLPMPQPLDFIAAAVRGLFANSEQGAWYDPSDFSTMYQDSTGTTPVTAVEQPVGLLLDKRKGLVLGAEKLSNGGFSDSTGWTTQDGSTAATVTSGEAVVTAGSYIQQSGLSFPAGTAHKISFVIRATGSAELKLSLATGDYAAGEQVIGTAVISDSATVSFIAVNNTVAKSVLLIKENYGTSGTLYIDSISVKLLDGNHATQATSAARPVLSARVNLITRTEDLTDAAWVRGANSIVGGVADPEGGNTAFTFTAAGANGEIYQGNSSGAPVLNGVSSVWLRRRTGTGTVRLYAGVTNGYVDVVITSSWARYAVSHASTGQGYVDVLLVTSGDAVDIWRPQLEETAAGISTPTAYQRVTTSTDYDTAGFPHYLKFDGVDDGLVTAAIDFTGTDKMTVLAGVSTVSGDGSVAELGIVGDAGHFHTVSGGTAYFTAGSPGARSYAYFTDVREPHVLSGVFDRAGASAPTEIPTLRSNGEALAPTYTFDGGATGNFGNLPIYIGRRGGVSDPLNGNLYGLIIRGAASTAAQISSTESYLAGKTGVTL